MAKKKIQSKIQSSLIGSLSIMEQFDSLDIICNRLDTRSKMQLVRLSEYSEIVRSLASITSAVATMH